MDKHRRSIRLPHFDYSKAGVYYITVCTADRQCLFGHIADGVMHRNTFGEILNTSILETENVRKNVTVNYYVIMPNHFHAIILIRERSRRRGVLQYAPTDREQSRREFRSPSQTIGAIVRGIKGATAAKINIARNSPGQAVWQGNYYERVIRNEKELYNMRVYIENNPLQWQFDSENPDVIVKSRKRGL